MPKRVRVSLANKCQLLFGAAVILILTAALAVVWMRMQVLVSEGQQETARYFANAWLTDRIQLGGELASLDTLEQFERSDQRLSLMVVTREEFDAAAALSPFLDQAIERFETRPDKNEHSGSDLDADGDPYFSYARAIRKSDLSRIGGGAAAGFSPTIETPSLANPLVQVLFIRLRSDRTLQQLTLNRIYIVAAGLLAGLLAIAVFWFITTRLILSPVRVLRDTAEKVSEGDLNIRSDINTGDEFEQLSDMFNQMLGNLNSNQEQLRKINKSLDLKLNELAETNVALFEANKIKSEFLANVSHELRTPLNSIIGFAEVLGETLRDRTGPVDEKRKRYVGNIIASSRHLLNLINDLLDLAKIEAGRMEVRVGPMSVADTAEGLINLIRPQAEKRGIELRLRVQPNIPIVQTDPGKFQQIVFNFLSNAVKFTPEGGVVTLAAETIPPRTPAGQPIPAAARPASGEAGSRPAGEEAPAGPAAFWVRVSVSDTGPGIAPADQDRIFEKFTQLDATVTREHGGTGLGLTISRQLAELLRARIELDSDLGKGATFSLLIPPTLESRSAPLMPDLTQGGPVRPLTESLRL